MRTSSWMIAVGAIATAPLSSAQFSVARSGVPRVTSASAPSGSGSFLMGADECAAPHTFAGTGETAWVQFATGTNGTTGQAEAECLFFGNPGIDRDIWFDWTSDWNGNAWVRTCSGTTVNTKIAVWPDHAPTGCPPDGASLGCNDNACGSGAQSTVHWTVTAGATYTIQIGTFPGAAGGSGSFQILEPFLPCGRYDDGSIENVVGLAAGGELGWLHSFDACMPDLGQIATAYGAPGSPGSVTNGSATRLAVYWDPDCDQDPRTGLVPLWTGSGVVTNGNTGLLSTHLVSPTLLLPSGTCLFVLASADHDPGQYPGPMDMDNPFEHAWAVGSTTQGGLDLVDLNANTYAPLNMSEYGIQGTWLLRYDYGEYCLGCVGGTLLCYGDGMGAACGCANEGVPFQPAGCRNGLGLGGRLVSGGLPSVTQDSLELFAFHVRAQPGLFFQGDIEIAGGDGVTFGDGIRCCGSNVIRLEVVQPSGPEPAGASSAVQISSLPPQSISAGDTRCYQYWYRDPAGSPCGSNFNLTNAMRIQWMP